MLVYSYPINFGIGIVAGICINAICMHVWHHVSCRGVNQTSLFNDMPHCMHADVSLSVMEELLKNVRWNHTKSLLFTSHVYTPPHLPCQVPIFQNSETAFLRHLSLTAQPLIFLPGEYIVRKGDIGYGLFLIRSGKVSADSLRMLPCTSYLLTVNVCSLH